MRLPGGEEDEAPGRALAGAAPGGGAGSPAFPQLVRMRLGEGVRTG